MAKLINAASGRDDDVLLLSQLSGQTHKCCISPLSIQKDGASEGPSAEWVSARYELTDGARTIVLRDEILCPWNLMEGGVIVYKSSAAWNCLKVFPDIPESMRKILGLSKDDTMFFELSVNKLIISSTFTMIRMSKDKEIRKSISFVKKKNSSKAVICVE